MRTTRTLAIQKLERREVFSVAGLDSLAMPHEDQAGLGQLEAEVPSPESLATAALTGPHRDEGKGPEVYRAEVTDEEIIKALNDRTQVVADGDFPAQVDSVMHQWGREWHRGGDATTPVHEHRNVTIIHHADGTIEWIYELPSVIAAGNESR